MYRPGRSQRKKFVRALKIVGGAIRVTIKKRLQARRTGELRGSLKGRPQR